MALILALVAPTVALVASAVALAAPTVALAVSIVDLVRPTLHREPQIAAREASIVALTKPLLAGEAAPPLTRLRGTDKHFRI